MLVVRKEGKAHEAYNSFRSAFELLEAVGREPTDSFEETEKDLPPLETLKQSMILMQQQVDEQKKTYQSGMHDMKMEIQELKTEMQALKTEIKTLKTENEILRFNNNGHATITKP